MESKAKLFGHPIHPMLIVFPLGLLATSVGFDIAYLVTGDGYWAGISYYLLSIGITIGLLAAIFGFIDWLYIPSGTRAKKIGTLHGLGNIVVVGLFLASCLMRWATPGNPDTLMISLSVAGLLLVLVTGWMGGELVDRLGVGVDEGANLNAPNSLSGRPADAHIIHPEPTTTQPRRAA